MELTDIRNHELFKYKFRPYSILSQKELLYNELYFSSLSELNDPYDTRIGYLFGKDEDRYLRLFKTCFNNNFNEHVLYSLSRYLAKTERTYEEVVSIINSDVIIDIGSKAVGQDVSLVEDIYHKYVIPKILEYLRSYIERFAYICSFTTDCSNPIMWSHYAQQHNGFSLVFYGSDNAVYENPLQRQVKVVYADGHIVYNNLPKKYEFQNVSYSNDITQIDAFMCFPEYVYGKCDLNEVKRKYLDALEKSAKTKYEKWRYESEVRLIDLSFESSMSGEVKKSINRIFHYDQTQLAGIIFGSKLTKENKDILTDVINKKRRDTYQQLGVLPFFYFMSAVINSRKYEMDIIIDKIIDSQNREIQNKDYKKEYDSQKDIARLMKNSRSDCIQLFRVFENS